MIYSIDDDSAKPALAPGVAISYWIGELPMEGAGELAHDISEAFPQSSIESEPGGLGGGLYTLFVEIGATVTLPHVTQLILDGIAFDLIKLGADKLFLRPLLAAQKRLKGLQKTRHSGGDFAYLRIQFIDCEIVVDADSRVNQSIADSLGHTLLLIAQNREALSLSSGRRPIQIYIPLIEDMSANRLSRFRAVLEVDETEPVSSNVFYEYWGLRYEDGSRRVFDVRRKLLIDEHYLLRKEYWNKRQAEWQSVR